MENNTTKKKNGKIIGRIIIALILLAGLFAGFSKIRDMQNYETTDDAQVETDITPISARVSGYINEIRFKENQPVKKGDTLILLDNRELKIKVEQAQSALQNAIASLDVAKANAIASHAGTNTCQSKNEELKIRLAYAEKELKRYANLLAENATTQQQYDKAKADKEALEKQLQSSNDQTNESIRRSGAVKEQIKVAESIVNQRKNDLEYAQLILSYSYILASTDGIVSKKSVQEGQLIQASQNLCAIVTDSLWVVANFKETQLVKMKIGQTVEVEPDAFKGKISATIESFSGATGAKFSLLPPDNATGNFVKVVQRIPVKILLDKNNELYKKLKPGMSIYVKVNINS
ncbi:MAG: HlyD family secretion protein [Bacteroidia bacterium]|nr:HlyD family secretion protein [Bacteroidia bacterium]